MASATFTFTISSVASTSVVVTPVVGLVAPVPPGTVVGNVLVAPDGWIGAISVDSPQVQVGGVAPNYTIQAATTLPAGTYTVNKVETLP